MGRVVLISLAPASLPDVEEEWEPCGDRPCNSADCDSCGKAFAFFRKSDNATASTNNKTVKTTLKPFTPITWPAVVFIKSALLRFSCQCLAYITLLSFGLGVTAL
jgi:hypothetical protein